MIWRFRGVSPRGSIIITRIGKPETATRNVHLPVRPPSLFHVVSRGDKCGGETPRRRRMGERVSSRLKLSKQTDSRLSSSCVQNIALSSSSSIPGATLEGI